MNKNKLNSFQLSTIIFNQIISLSLGLNIFNVLKQDNINSYITLIISYFLSLIPLTLILYIANYKPNLNIIEKINILYKKNTSIILNTIITLTILFISIILLFSISNFIIKEYLPNTNIIYASVIYAILIYIINTKGIEVISRTSIFLPIISIIFIIITFIGLIPKYDINNFFPILNNINNNPIITSLLYSFISISLVFSILIIPKNNIIDKHNYNKTIIISYTISSIINLILTIITIAVLGKYLINAYPYPEYIVLRKIKLFTFIDRLENIISIQWILSIFITLSLNIYYIKNYIKKNDKSKKISFITSTIFIIISSILIKTNILFNKFITNYYPYILSIITITILLISIKIYINLKHK